MAQYEAGVTAPFFNPWCRCCTAPYFDDDDSARCKQGKRFLVFGERKNIFGFSEPLTEEEITKAWKNAESEMYPKSIQGDLVINYQQEEIIRILNKNLKGFNFYGKL